MTFTLVARCPKSGQLGIGIATYSITVGLYCNGPAAQCRRDDESGLREPGQQYAGPAPAGQGFTPARVLDELKANDPDYDIARSP